MCGRSKLLFYEALESWLGGLDSNQDSQIQNLESCQLDDLPAGVRDVSRSRGGSESVPTNSELQSLNKKEP